MAEPGSPTGVAAPSAVGGPVDVIVDDQQAELAVDADRWAALAAAVLRSEGARGELTLTFVDQDEMTALNHEHMGQDRPTDVLSFPLDSLGSPDHDLIPGAPVLLGDVVVCPAVAAAAAPTHAGTVEDEIALLVVHGCLHVMGYDHAEPEETRIMRARELELLVAHHWGGPAPDGFRQEQDQ